MRGRNAYAYAWACVILSVLSAACGADIDAPAVRIACPIDGRDHPRHQRYQDVARSFVAAGLPGLVLAVDTPGQDPWVGAAGYADLEERIPMTPCHQHHLASIAKTYTAVLLLLLVEQGQVGLDERASSYLAADLVRDLPNGDAATIRQLLQHTSGIPSIFDLSFISDFFNNPTRRLTNDDLLAYARGRAPLAAPGAAYSYSDINFLLLALVADRVAGGHARALADRVLAPRGLTDTHYHDDAYPRPEGLVRSYWDRFGDGALEDVSDWQIVLTESLQGSDGVIASAPDVLRFVAELGGGALVSSDSLAAMTSWVPTPNDEDEAMVDGYGLGLMRHDTPSGLWFGHSGATLAAASFAYYHPQTAATVVGLTNAGAFFSADLRRLFFGRLLPALEAATLAP